MALYSRPTYYVKTFTARNCSFRPHADRKHRALNYSKAKCMPVTPTSLAHVSLKFGVGSMALWGGSARIGCALPCSAFRSCGGPSARLLAGMGIQPTPSEAIGQRHSRERRGSRRDGGQRQARSGGELRAQGAAPVWSGPPVACPQAVRPRPLCASTVPALREVAANGMLRHTKRVGPWRSQPRVRSGSLTTQPSANGDAVHTKSWGGHRGLVPPSATGFEPSQHIGARSQSCDMTSSLLCN